MVGLQFLRTVGRTRVGVGAVCTANFWFYANELIIGQDTVHRFVCASAEKASWSTSACRYAVAPSAAIEANGWFLVFLLHFPPFASEVKKDFDLVNCCKIHRSFFEFNSIRAKISILMVSIEDRDVDRLHAVFLLKL